MNSPYIFLSYARADIKFALPLKDRLSEQGIEVWIDKENISLGDNWEASLRTAIQDAFAVILVATPRSRVSSVVKDELSLAETFKRPIYPLWCDGEEWMNSIPLGFGGKQYIDARNGRDEQAIQQIASFLQKKMMVPSVSAPVPSLYSPPLPPPRNPYKGLHAFQLEDAGDFFGRDQLIADLMQAVGQLISIPAQSAQYARLLTVLGPSGSGKSSLVMAGLLPRLKQVSMFDSQKWIYLYPIVPETHPLEALAVSLAQQSSLGSATSITTELSSDDLRALHLLAWQLVRFREQKVVLFIDQFEEVFTHQISEKERRHFLDLLVTAVTEPDGPLLVILTLRADFYDRPMYYPELYGLLDKHRFSVLSMEHEDLRQAIEQPARLPNVQVTFEGDLVGNLLFEVQGQPGTLPLLQFTLDQLFQQRNGHILTLEAYHEIGGLKGALTQHAEATYSLLPTEEHRIQARLLFLRLINPGLTEQDTTRRRIKLTELELSDPRQTTILRETKESFIRARLLSSNKIEGIPIIEVSHEALIRAWPRLIDWLHEVREDIYLQQTISQDAIEWQQHNQQRDRLYRGSQLREARAWAKRSTPNKNEEIFLQVSRKWSIGLALSRIVIVIVLIVTLGSGGWLLSHQSPDPTHVTNLQDDGVGSLRWAIANAPSGSTITFDRIRQGHTIVLAADLVFSKKELSIHGPGTDMLTISNKTHQIDVVSGASVSIFGLAFVGSEHNPSSLFINEGMLSLTNCSIADNVSSGGSNLIHSNEPFIGNGGGISNTGTLSLTNSIVSGNASEADNGGGGISNGGTLIMTDSTISSNTSSENGGGILNSGILTVTDSTISNNKAVGNLGVGVSNANKFVLLADSSSTSPDRGAPPLAVGGGGIASNGTITLINSTVSSNTVTGPESNGGGGGISNTGTLTLLNVTVSENIATDSGDGGGILSEGGGVDITFSTLLSNTAFKGGGILTRDSSDTGPTVLTMRNSLVVENHTSVDPDITGVLTSDGYNLIQNTSGITILDPHHKHHTDISVQQFTDLHIDAKLRLNGGRTQTHALFPGSPAIDKIPLGACQTNKISTDQRGVKRPQGSTCDIGSYEYTPKY